MTTSAPAAPAHTNDRLSSLPKLGVGLSFQLALRPFIQQHPDSFDYIEVIPDTLWSRHSTGTTTHYEESPQSLALLEELRALKPLVAHSIGLSIGSADHFDQNHLDQIARWQARYGCPWHSDHLSFSQLEEESGHTLDVGFTMPVPYDEASLDMVAERVMAMQQRVPVPFLLENNVYYFSIPEQEMSEPQFLNRLAARTGCGLLLDLHNIYTNARNHGFDPYGFLEELDLTRVVEIHIGGGMLHEDFYLDAHSGPCPEELWDMLAATLERAPNAAGVTFEVFNAHYPDMGPARLIEELEHARAIWQRFH
ncbi:MAG: DUF692 domain-containing protein [Roseiflexaceae bacterium]